TELDAGTAVRLLGMWPRQRHGHVEVVRTRVERAVENRHGEPRVDRVEHVRDVVRPTQLGDVRRRRGVDRGRGEPVVGHRGHRALGPVDGIVRGHERVEEPAPGGDGHDRRTDAPGAHHQDVHAAASSALACRRARSWTSATITRAMTKTAVPTTFTSRGMPRWAEPQTNIGNVTLVPELKLVMMKSSNDSDNDNSAAAAMPGSTSGRVTLRNVAHSVA